MRELLLAAKSGNEEALEQLFRRYRPLVYSIKNKYFLRDFDEQDWLQEGFIVFYGCVEAFEESLGITLGAFFKRSFENRIRSLVRKECAFKRKSNQNTISFEQQVIQEGTEFLGATTFAENPLQQLIVQEAFEECQDSLSDLERAAFVKYALKQEQAACYSEKALKSAYDRSKRKICVYLRDQP